MWRDTTYVVCVSQLEHLALDNADPQDPLYVALRDNLESGAIAKCEAAGAEAVNLYFTGTNCATTGTDPVSSNFVHTGACWNAEKYDLDEEVCPLIGECRPYYDCSSEPIASLGDDEAGGDEGLAWECDEPGFAELEIQRE